VPEDRTVAIDGRPDDGMTKNGTLRVDRRAMRDMDCRRDVISSRPSTRRR
jgi:hypothetical protein